MTKKKNIQPISVAEKKPKAENKSVAKAKTDKFIITIKLGNMAICGKGDTALEALQNIPVPSKIMTKGIITISQGQKKKELVYTVPKLRRLFYPNAQPIIIKYLASLLK